MITNLGITIEKLLTLEKLKASRILAGKSGSKNKITKVNVMEVPDIVEWVSEGEFLITTAYSIRENIDILSEIIPKLKAKGVAGIGIKLGRYIKDLPQNVIAVADNVKLPILEIPSNISHTEIISSILTEVINDQTSLLINMENFNKEVMNIMAKDGTLKDIAQKLYDYLGNTIAIYENISDTYEIINNNKDNLSEIENIIYSFITQRSNSYHTYYQNIDELQGEKIERVTIPIYIKNIEYGYIFIWIDKKEISQIDKIMIESYLNIVVLEFVKKISVYNNESNYKLEFFDDLLSDSKSRQKRAIEKAKNYGFNKESKYSVIMILLKEWSEESTNNVQAEINRLLFIINRLIKPYRNKIIYIEKTDRIILLYGSVREDNSNKIKDETLALCRKIYSEALNKITSIEISIGIGRSYEDFSQLNKSYEQAKLIVENLNNSTHQSIIHYDNLGIYRILAYDGLKAELIDFCYETIMPLIQHDKEYNSELVKTLKQYFKYNGNVKKISETMYMHYNTITYRINKIKDITGIDLEDYDNRLNLQVALKILDIISIN